MALAMDEEKKRCQLPNDVLGYIVPKLNLREGTISSLVSRDWRYAWSRGVTDLDFDASWKFPPQEQGFFVHRVWRDYPHLDTKGKLRRYKKVRRDDARWYVSWVNRVVESLRVEHINRFRVKFNLNKLWEVDIDRWLAFALEKRVKTLEFDFSSLDSFDSDYLYPFSDISDSTFDSDYPYPFPDISDSIQRLRIFPSHHVHDVYSSITNLQSLSLISVRVSSRALEFLLSNCPLLEKLCIRDFGEIIHLRISGSSLPLKHLQIYKSNIKESFEIDAPNLSSFEFDDYLSDEKIKMGNTQKLTTLTIPCTSFFENFCQYTPQLEELVILNCYCLRHILRFIEGVELLGLKRAELRVAGFDGTISFLHIIYNLLNGAPHLVTLKIDLGPRCRYFEDKDMDVDDDDVPTCHQHAFLRSVEISDSRSSRIKDDDQKQGCKTGKVLKHLAQELEQTLPSRTQLLFPLD